MRKARLFSHDPKGILPRMSWSPHNLYNLIARSTVQTNSSQLSFTRTTATIYQQRWRSKRFLRAYHGDWIPERRFKRWFLPTDLPQVVSASSVRKGSSSVDAAQEISSEERLPVASLFLRDVERRIDTIVFRCCFARSAYEARSLVIHGKVKMNGLRVTDPNTLLNPGDLISVEPAAIPMLSPEMAKRAADAKIEELRSGSSEEAGEGAGAAAPSEGDASAETSAGEAAEGAKAEGDSAPAAAPEAEAQGKGKGRRQDKEAKEAEALPAGVLPFHLPPYAAPFLFVPPYLEPSFATCSAIYLRHPTIIPTRKPMGTLAMQPRALNSGRDASAEQRSATRRLPYHTDLPTPYAAGEELFSLAWEHYAKDAPRVRGDARRQRLEARVGRNGLLSVRAKDEWKKRMAVRRGWTKGSGETKRAGFGDGGSLRIESDRRRGASAADKKVLLTGRRETIRRRMTRESRL